MALFTATACGQIKEQQGARRVLRRGLRARNAEWKLLCATRNLLKLWRHGHSASGQGSHRPSEHPAES
jgi:hypothetical protein